MNCAIAQSLDQIGDWWTLLIVREAFYGSTTFSAFQKRLGIAKNVLSDRLSHLIETEVLVRAPTQPDGERESYLLTEKGSALLPVLVALMQWGDKWVVGAGKAPVSLGDARTGEKLAQIRVTTEDGRPVALEELAISPGPGADRAVRTRLETAAIDRSKLAGKRPRLRRQRKSRSS